MNINILAKEKDIILYNCIYIRNKIELSHEMGGVVMLSLEVRCVILGRVKVTITPALVPSHNNSRCDSSDVMRKQDILCCRIMSSVPDHVDSKKDMQLLYTLLLH